jgi:lipid II:glycine glycyltransferase (peptidoglycan interpeptide bridge formation enzyme)
VDYYQQAWALFLRAGLGQALLAEADGQAIGGLVLFQTGRKVWYFYGMSGNTGRDLQPNYLLQWTAIRWAKARGYALYDWWGAPNHFLESDPMWGVYRFKDGFGGQVVRHIGAWDYAPYPPLYWLYEQARPRLLAWLRRRGGEESSDSIS